MDDLAMKRLLDDYENPTSKGAAVKSSMSTMLSFIYSLKALYNSNSNSGLLFRFACKSAALLLFLYCMILIAASFGDSPRGGPAAWEP